MGFKFVPYAITQNRGQCNLLFLHLRAAQGTNREIPSVTLTITLLAKFRREFPNERSDQHWKRVHPTAMPNYQGQPFSPL
jgi:hypothetical protein